MNFQVAMLSAACMQADALVRREDQFEHELQWSALHPACAAQGIDLHNVIWDRDDWNPTDFNLLVLGTVWDYMERPDEFMARMEQLAEACPLANSLETIRWNYDKSYLRDLERLAAPVVPTLWTQSAHEEGIAHAFEHFGCDEIVVKPTIGAGAWRQARIRRGQTWPSATELPPAECMVQPFLPAIATEGEYSLLFFGGQFSHCAQKLPKSGDYRVQSMYGASERTHFPNFNDLHLANKVLSSVTDIVGEQPLYARVDMVRGLKGNLQLMELELIEPYLYPEQGSDMGTHFARALVKRLKGL